MPRLAPVIKTVFCAMFTLISQWADLGWVWLALFLPLYWVKPAETSKLIGALEIFSS
jgi:hypothetical protein